MARTAYNPGTPQPAVRMPDGSFIIDSFRGELKTYRVNLAENRCTCPDWTKRHAEAGTDCKHLKSVRAQEWARCAAKAQACTDTELVALLPKYEADGNLTVALAIRSELHERQAQVIA